MIPILVARHVVCSQQGSTKGKAVANKAASSRQAQPLTDGSEGQAEKWTELASWAEKRGISWSKWLVSDVGNGLRGAVATAPIAAGETIVTAPVMSTLIIRDAEKCPLPEDFVPEGFWAKMDNFWNIRLALLLIHERRKGADSEWAPYIAVLPEEFGLPWTYTDKELDELQSPAFREDVVSERQFYTYQAEELRSLLPEGANKVTDEEFFWGLGCVGSRTFTADFGEGRAPGELMCPVADMVNHKDTSRPAFRWNPDAGADGAFELFSPDALQKGDEVSISYGDVSNEHLLHYYGFVPEQNCHDHQLIFERDILSAARAELVGEGGGDEETLAYKTEAVVSRLVSARAQGLTLPLAHLKDSSVVARAAEEGSAGHEFKLWPGRMLPDDMMIFARALAAAALDVRGAMDVARALQGGAPAAPAIEAAARRVLARAFKGMLAEMPTTLEEDREALAGLMDFTKPSAGCDPGRRLMCLRYRMGRKETLIDGLDTLTIPTGAEEEE